MSSVTATNVTSNFSNILTCTDHMKLHNSSLPLILCGEHTCTVDICGTCDICGGNESKNVIRKPHGKRILGLPKQKLEDYIKKGQ